MVNVNVLMFCFLLLDRLTALHAAQSRPAGANQNPSALTELPDIRPEEQSHKENTHTADSEQKQTAVARTKPVSHSDFPASGTGVASADSGLKAQTAALTRLRSQKASQQTAPPSQVDTVHVSVRSKSRELYLQGAERQNKPLHVREAPVREERPTDCNMTSSDSDTSFQVSRLAFSGGKVEAVKPFSVSAASARHFGEHNNCFRWCEETSNNRVQSR